MYRATLSLEHAPDGMTEDEPSYKRRHLVPLKIAERRNLVVGYDSAGYINSAYQANPFLIDALLARRVIGYDHHFYGVQFITMRKLFLRDVSVKVGMLRVQSEDGAAEEKPIPMEPLDYLKVLHGMRNNRWKQIVLAICDEEADPGLCDRHARTQYDVGLAFDQLCEAVKALWEAKKALLDAQGADDRFR